MKPLQFFLIISLLVVFAPTYAFCQWANLDNIHPFSWKDGPEAVKDRLASATGTASQAADIVDSATSSQGQGTGVISVLEMPIVFADYPALFNAGFDEQKLSALNFKIQQVGDRESIQKVLLDVYAFLKDLYGLPQTVNLLSGEKVWKNHTGSQTLSLRMVTQSLGEDKKKSVSKIFGEAKISGSIRRLYSKSEEYSSESSLDAGTAKSKNPITIVNEVPYQKISAIIYINFINRHVLDSSVISDQKDEDPAVAINSTESTTPS
ncbi:MAG: hypothetical protein ACRCVN_01760 [Spirochaetia bacterium]